VHLIILKHLNYEFLLLKNFQQSLKIFSAKTHCENLRTYNTMRLKNLLMAIAWLKLQLLNTVRGAMRAQAEVVARPVLVRAASVKEVALRRMSSACDIGLQRADDALNTRVGSIAAESIDVTLGLAEHLMDSYLPARESDDVFVKDEGKMFFWRKYGKYC
jgi:hypothetical protein